jgi:hypothetical protein
MTLLDRQRIRHFRDLIESNTSLLRVLRRCSPRPNIAAPGEPRVTAANRIKEVSAKRQRFELNRDTQICQELTSPSSARSNLDEPLT